MIEKLLAAGALQGAAAAVPQRRHEAVERERSGGAGVPEDRSRRAAWRSATTTTTAAIDVLIGNNGGAPVLLKNNAGEGNHWVGIKLQGTACNRDAIGATITWSVGGKTRSRLKVERRQLPLVARPARGARPRHRRQGGLGRDQVAAAERPRRAPHRHPRDRYVTVVEGKGWS